MEITANQFSNGLNLDQHPLTIDQTTLTDALNATFLTKNGNELMLQNDMGNTLIQDSRTGKIMGLSEGFIPLGMKEYGGVLYIASYNPETEEGELGSIPSPLITYTIGEEQENKNDILLTKENYTTLQDSVENKYVKISDTKLKPGDSFYIVLELERHIDEIIRKNEICGKFEDGSLTDLYNELTENNKINGVFLCKKEDITKSIFSNSDQGKGLYNVELYTKTQSHGILPLEGIQNKEVQYYIKNDFEIKGSNYWFIDKYKILSNLNANQSGEHAALDLDMKRSISAESFLSYPNYPNGYLCTKLSPVLPEIDGMLINKSTGIKSPYLYMGTEEKKYTYEDTIIPQFYELNYKEDDNLQSSNLGIFINNWKTDSEVSDFLKCTKDSITTIGDLISGKIIFAVHKKKNGVYTLFLLEDDLQTINAFEIGVNNKTNIEYHKFLVYLAVKNGSIRNLENIFASFDIDNLNYITKLLPQYSNYYYIVIPGFYCNSGVLTIDKINLVNIEKNGFSITPDYKTWPEGGLTRSTELNSNSITFIGENQKDTPDGFYLDNYVKKSQPSTFVQIFDINTKCDKSIICLNNNDNITLILNKDTNHPCDYSKNNEGLFAFLINEKDLNSTFKMTFEFYSKVPDNLLLHNDINSKFNWELNKDGTEYLVLTKDFYYTPKAIQLDSYTIQSEDVMQLRWHDSEPPELKLNQDVLFGIKNNEVYDYGDTGNTLTGYGPYNCDNMCTAYLYPYIQLKLDSKNRIDGSRVCIGGFSNEESDWANKKYYQGVYKGLTKRTQEPYHFYDDNYKSSSEHTWGDENTFNTLRIKTLSDLQAKGIYCCNMNWFKYTDAGVVYNKNNLPYRAATGKDLISSDIFNSIPHGMLNPSGMVMTVRPTSDFIENNFNFSNKDDKPSYRCRSSYSTDISDKIAIGVDHRSIRNWVAANIDNNKWYRETSFPKYDTSGKPIADGGQFGHNRYLEFLYCCMRTFCKDTPLYTKGFTSTNQPFKNYSNNAWTKTYTITEPLKFENNFSYLYKKAFKIKIYNKSTTLCKFYHLFNNPEKEQQSATLKYKLIYQGAFENDENKNSIIDISSSSQNIFTSKDNCTAQNIWFNNITPHPEDQNILSNEFCYNVKVEFSVQKEKHNYMRPGLIGIIPSYQFFLDLDNIKLKKEQKTDRMIIPYFNVANTKNKPFNSNLGVEQDRLVSDETCNGNPWKYEIISTHDPKEMCLHGDKENWVIVKTDTTLTLHINIGQTDGGFPNQVDTSMHILKVSGCCGNENMCDFKNSIKIKSCKIYNPKEPTKEYEIEFDHEKNDSDVSDYLMFKINNDWKEYYVDLTFESDTLVKSVYGFDYLNISSDVCYLYVNNEINNDSSANDKNYEPGFYFTHINNKRVLYPLFPEYYVYCENGIKCANKIFYDILKYPLNPYARVYGYYTIEPIKKEDSKGNLIEDNDYHNEGSPILYTKVSEFYTEEEKKSVPMKTIETYTSYYKD